MKNKQSGFTLIELLIVVVIVGVLAVISALIYSSVRTGQINNLQRVRLMEYASAQAKFRDNGKRRYGSLKELCQEGLLSDTVIKMDTACDNQTPINNWKIVPGSETASFLRDHFFASLTFESRPSGDTTRIVCVGEDGVMRQSDAGSLDVCNSSSAAFNP